MEGLEDDTPSPAYAAQAHPDQNLQYEASLQLDLEVDATYAPDRGRTDPFPPRQTPTLTETAPFRPQPQTQPWPAPQSYAEKQATSAFTSEPQVPSPPATQPYAQNQATQAFTPEPQVRLQPAYVPFQPYELPKPYQTPATYTAPSGLQKSNQSQPTPVLQEVAVQKPAPQFGVWTTGIFDCKEDPTNATVTAFFPCVTFGLVADILDHGHPSCYKSGMVYFICCLCPWTKTTPYRTRLRIAYGLPDSPAPDCLTHFFCVFCAICQEYRELRNRGLDPGIGSRGHLMRAQQHKTATIPPLYQTMRP